MSRLVDELKERRSIRKFKARAVPQELVLAVLEAAGLAPSAHNAQPWRFVIITDELVKKRLAEAMAESWVSDAAKDGSSVPPEKLRLSIERFASAPILILACLTLEGMVRFADVERRGFERDLALQGLGAGLENLLLAAHWAGLGACWFGAPGFCKEAVRRVLAVPFDVDPEALVVMGYAVEKPGAPVRKRLVEYCFRDVWGRSLV